MEINVINKSNNAPPEFSHEGDAGMDLRAFLDSPQRVSPGETVIIPTGIQIALPRGYVGMVCSRSGLSIKQGICVINSPGIIDSGYTDQIYVGLINHHPKNTYLINNNDRIAQILFLRHESPTFRFVEQLGESLRGDGGLGSTGIQ